MNDYQFSYRQPWMTDDQWRCAELFAEVFGGFHHLPTIQECGTGVRVFPHENSLATHDFNRLTALVMLAHRDCIRVSVGCRGMKLEIQAHARDPNSKSLMRGHPTIMQALDRSFPELLKTAGAP